jgi:DNA gyrase inhibitor GyrI
MTVDFEVVKAPKYYVASLTRQGPWTGDNMMRPYFSKLLNWARKNKLRTGKWIYTELVGPNAPPDKRVYEASLELQNAKKLTSLRASKVRVQILPTLSVVRIKFNPELVSSRLVYHGLESWIEWRKRYGEYARSDSFWSREIYRDDPWKSKVAWENAEVQVPIRKL